MHPFGNVVCTVSLPGRIVLEALNAGVSRLPVAAGQFPQISGMTMRVELQAAGGARVSEVRIQGAPLELDRLYTLAVPDYVLRGGDGYLMFEGLRVLEGPETGPQIVTALETYLASRRTVAPATEGRITISISR
jgi:5'-nucleotidase